MTYNIFDPFLYLGFFFYRKGAGLQSIRGLIQVEIQVELRE